jgi:hypothetical protein
MIILTWVMLVLNLLSTFINMASQKDATVRILNVIESGITTYLMWVLVHLLAKG